MTYPFHTPSRYRSRTYVGLLIKRTVRILIARTTTTVVRQNGTCVVNFGNALITESVLYSPYWQGVTQSRLQTTSYHRLAPSGVDQSPPNMSKSQIGIGTSKDDAHPIGSYNGVTYSLQSQFLYCMDDRPPVHQRTLCIRHRRLRAYLNETLSGFKNTKSLCGHGLSCQTFSSLRTKHDPNRTPVHRRSLLDLNALAGEVKQRRVGSRIDKPLLPL